MNEGNDTSKFQLSGDDEAPETILQDELQELKIEKLGHRVTLLTILIPCMIGVIMVIAYLDIKDRVTRSQDTGAIGVEKLSKDLESKFSSLSLEQAKIKDIQANKIPELEKSAAFLQSKLKNLQTSINKMATATIDRDELTRIVDTLNQKVNEIPQALSSDVQSIVSDIESLAAADSQIAADTQQVREDLQTFSDNIANLQAGIDVLEKEMASLAETAIDKGELELALKLKEIGYRQTLLEKTTPMEKEIQALKNEIEALQKGQTTSSAAPPSTNTPPASVQKKTPQQPVVTKPAPASESTPEPPASGSIVEQTIE